MRIMSWEQVCLCNSRAVKRLGRIGLKTEVPLLLLENRLVKESPAVGCVASSGASKGTGLASSRIFLTIVWWALYNV
jgi:hypothetical protein